MVIMQLLLVAPLLSILCGIIIFLAIGGEVGAMLGCFTPFVIFAVYFRYLVKSEEKKFKKYLLSLGLTPDHIVTMGAYGIGIDREKRQIFIGNIKTGKLFDFDDIKGVDIEQIPSKDPQRDSVHRITVKTMNYDTPSVTVALRPRDGKNTFEKMRVALDKS